MIATDVRSVKVINLRTLCEVGYCNDLPVRTNVRNAYLQMEQGDFNTWDYDSRMCPEIKESDLTISCGDWCALKDKVPVLSTSKEATALPGTKEPARSPLTPDQAMALPDNAVAVSGYRCRDCGCRPNFGTGQKKQWHQIHHTLYCETCWIGTPLPVPGRKP